MTIFQLLDLYILLLNDFYLISARYDVDITSKYSKFLLSYLVFKSYFDFDKMIFFGIVFVLYFLKFSGTSGFCRKMLQHTFKNLQSFSKFAWPFFNAMHERVKFPCLMPSLKLNN